ncbi:bifunctional 2-polyprenyl-6-hydroxyphenol methylase/3-demethylubiquinol 3-O-methyltransferase UbiG [Streptomyces sp. S1D4-14]|uniref:class I SAM-dependent methyltransferase n=1 Tax=Streptomyces sp. S1D4-14 TaxID=2594461 RepID=UPI0011647ABE|nr:class I SAM-dependent methyltransferase [Streptomyces sp. S1D4-14]QDN64429.1 class I SAM-dependent methyltransferase [Streptomyces sp. S1D4-14]
MPAPTTAAEYWDTYKPHRGDGPQPRPAADRFDWTGIPGHGPGAELLGDPKTALDLGPAEGENAAFLVRHGVQVTAVDFSEVQVRRARALWEGTDGLEFVLAEACAFLDNDAWQWDAVYSTWGAVWFTDPERLFPLVIRRLAPGGVFAFSHREPAGDEYGAQQMGGKWLEGRESELVVHRWQYSAEQWAGILKRHNFTDVRAEVLPSPAAGDPGTLIVRART